MLEVRMKSKEMIIVIISIFILIITAILLIIEKSNKFRVKRFDKEIELNYGDIFVAQPGEICYEDSIYCADVDIFIEGEVDSKKLGEQKVTYVYKYNDKEKRIKQKIKIVDNEKPTLEVDIKDLKVCPNGKYDKNKINIHAIDNVDGDISENVNMSIKEGKLVFSVSDSNNNTTIKEIGIKYEDNEKPKISIIGDDKIVIGQNNKYEELGATATDNCDDSIKIEINNKVNTEKVGVYSVEYIAKDLSGNISRNYRTVIVKAEKKDDKVNLDKVNNNLGEKIIYLTFDDGPSDYTSMLLDVLKKYNVKATFFVTGRGDDDLILREYQEGHTIGLHTNTHNYSYVYKNVENYYKDLYDVRNRVKKITGFESNFVRFPGGSSNTISKKYDGGIHIMSYLTRDIEKNGFKYFDWNVTSGDAGETTSTDKVYKNVISRLRENESIVLQHDTKEFSVKAVEKIIQYGLSYGYTFKALDTNSYQAHHKINN